MNVSGEWVAALALNAVRHRMGSRHAIETVTARWVQQRRDKSTSQPEHGASIALAIPLTISANALFRAASTTA